MGRVRNKPALAVHSLGDALKEAVDSPDKGAYLCRQITRNQRLCLILRTAVDFRRQHTYRLEHTAHFLVAGGANGFVEFALATLQFHAKAYSCPAFD